MRARRVRLVLAAAGVMIAAGLLLIPAGSDLGLVDSARASTDIDPCGTANESTTPLNPALRIDAGSGHAALRCGYKDIGFPPLAPEDVLVEAPDAGKIDPAFKDGFPYMIGRDGEEVSYTAITSDDLIIAAFSSAGISLTIEGISAQLFPPVSYAVVAGAAFIAALEGVLEEVVRSLISEEEAMQGADWDWTVPSKTGTGDWYGWFTWSGTGGYVDEKHPAITPSSINPALINWYSYNVNDPYYQQRKPAPYARVFLGATSVTMKQGPGIHSDVETYARQGANGGGPCGVVRAPACLGNGTASSASTSASISRRRHRKRAGKTILQDSKKAHSTHGTSRNDEIRAIRGDHEVRAGTGHDLVLAGRGDDRLYGGGDSDELTSFRGDDRLGGGAGHDVLQGGSGNDVSIGSGGSDSLFDAGGQNHMFAGSGDDRIVVQDRHERDQHDGDVVDCGRGRDMVIADPSDQITLTTGSTVPAGTFTADHTPANSTCELVYSSVHMPPRNPPRIGHHAGRPPGTPEPSWPVFD